MINCILRTSNGLCFANIDISKATKLVFNIDRVARPVAVVQIEYGRKSKSNVTVWAKRRVPRQPLWIDFGLEDGRHIIAFDVLVAIA